ncbi:unnamed protein product [Prunus armeniaca]
MKNAKSSSVANDELLTVTEEKCNGDVVARDKTSCDVLGLGTMKIKMQNGVVGSLTEVEQKILPRWHLYQRKMGKGSYCQRADAMELSYWFAQD